MNVNLLYLLFQVHAEFSERANQQAKISSKNQSIRKHGQRRRSSSSLNVIVEEENDKQQTRENGSDQCLTNGVKNGIYVNEIVGAGKGTKAQTKNSMACDGSPVIETVFGNEGNAMIEQLEEGFDDAENRRGNEQCTGLQIFHLIRLFAYRVVTDFWQCSLGDAFRETSVT